MINAVYCTMAELTEGKLSYTGQDDSVFSLLNFRTFTRPTFLDYLRSGWAISIVGAIDYTASNGNPISPESLHHIGGYDGMN